MIMNILEHQIGLGEAAIYSLVAIVLVFVVLLILIGVTYLVFKLLDLFSSRKKKEEPKVEEKSSVVEPIEINNEDKMVAVLVASIDYRNEIKKDVKVVSVKELN